MKNIQNSEFKDFILDQLSELPEVMTSPMFSSYGLYSNDIFFGIINHGNLYLKTNEESRQKYEEQGMLPFQPSSKQKLINYYMVPVEVIEDSDTLTAWAREAVEVQIKESK